MEVGVGVIPFVLLLLYLFSVRDRVSVRGNLSKARSHVRQIIAALKVYSSDHGGLYPDRVITAATTSNDVFRELFRSGIADYEPIFGSPQSVFVPDGNIGLKPDYTQAVAPGENHWAMTAGLSDADASSTPLLYDNPVKTTWPPKWEADVEVKSSKGRSWPKGVMVGMNDGSISLLPLEMRKGKAVGLKKQKESAFSLFSSGKDLFEAAVAPEGRTHRVLDVAIP